MTGFPSREVIVEATERRTREPLSGEEPQRRGSPPVSRLLPRRLLSSLVAVLLVLQPGSAFASI